LGKKKIDMEEDLRINRCKKYQDKTCPNMDSPEMQKIKLRESAGGFDPIAYWEDLKKANDKFCVTCNQFDMV